MMDRLRLGVLYGGWSTERDVSSSSARQVLRYLDRSRYDVVPIEIRGDRVWLLRTGGNARPTDPSTALRHIDAALLVLHGIGGEDGVIQGLLEAHDVPYTGPAIGPSAIFMDKVLAKWQFLAHHIPTPEHVTGVRDERDDLVCRIVGTLGVRTVIKPARQGSSFGVTVTQRRDDIVTGLERAFGLDDRVLVERFVPGTEVQVGILGHWFDHEVLPTLELEFRDGQTWFDPETKYGTDRSRITFHVPARISEAATDTLRRTASTLYERYQFTGYARFDFLVPPDGAPLLLEINTITGMTPTSTYPLMARRAGISYPELLGRLIELAIQRPRAELRVPLPL